MPEWIRNGELSDVNLSHCELRGTLPNFTTLNSLNTIDLSANFSMEGISNFFAHMSSLQKGKISHNLFKSDVAGFKFPMEFHLLTSVQTSFSGLFQRC